MVEQIEIKSMDVKRFNALASHSRSPVAAYFSEEISWYSNGDETVIGTVLLDTVDNDYAAIVLGRDEGGRFRAFDVASSVRTVDEATRWLTATIKWHTGMGNREFQQGKDDHGIDLFSPVVPVEKQHPSFVHLNREVGLLAAKSMIKELMPHFRDVDGNFVQQFQSQGFDARLWELYIFSYLTEEQLFINRKHSAPDFIIEKYGKTVAIEAVTVGRNRQNPPRYFRERIDSNPTLDVLEEHKNAMPIRFGSPLYSKLKKKYWELDHVKGNPLVFAIADFHDDRSMLWSSTALINYLYGSSQSWHYDDNNQLVIVPSKIATHSIEGKEIPSGFFLQPESENVSAVLFSSSGTISKFNRLGRQAGFGDPSVTLIRWGTHHDHDPNASVPLMFKYEVNEKCHETWGQGLSMYHNANAIHPVPEELFPTIAHHHFRDGQLVSTLPDFYPYGSVTLVLRPEQKGS